jgi:hypothetical protein
MNDRKIIHIGYRPRDQFKAFHKRKLLGLIALREDEGVPPLMLTFVDSSTDQVVQGCDRFTGTPMAYQDGPA